MTYDYVDIDAQHDPSVWHLYPEDSCIGHDSGCCQNKVEALAQHLLQGGYIARGHQRWDMSHIFSQLYRNSAFMQALQQVCQAHAANDQQAQQAAVERCQQLTQHAAQAFIMQLLNAELVLSSQALNPSEPLVGHG